MTCTACFEPTAAEDSEESDTAGDAGDGDGDPGDGDGDGDGDSGDGDGCGNGVIDVGEECDDGNPDNTDACTTECRNALCGDGHVWEGVEACDDADDVDTDECSNLCELPLCGDGVVQQGEDCDDGDEDETDDCTSECLDAVCGDGIVHQGVEGCDDGNDVDDDECTNQCAPASCGDGLIQADVGEECDDQNQDDTDDCLSTCVAANCGDGNVWQGVEACDDDNDDDTDACLSTCEAASCGDGYVWADNEACDDGNDDNTDDCLEGCEPAACGDGYVWANNEACDDGNMDNSDDCLDSCDAASCGDGYVWANNEACDDGNLQSYDGCDDGCALSTGAKKVVYGYDHTCSLEWNGDVRCWGRNDFGQLGLGHTQNVGDNEPANAADPVDIDGGDATAVDIAAGGHHSCALFSNHRVKCWGHNGFGELGYGHISNLGDNEALANLGWVAVGDDVVSLSLGWYHTCALTDTQQVRCWGLNNFGQLGKGDTSDIGDNEQPGSIAAINVADDVVDIAAGYYSSCALLAGGGVRCWGHNGFGELGQGNTTNIGDNELPSSIPVISLGNTAIIDIASSGTHTCVLYEDATIRCWGLNETGQLGYGHTNNIGDNEQPAFAAVVNVGADVDEVWTASASTCVRLGAEVKCWGSGPVNGRGNNQTLGDNEIPASFGNIDVGFDVTSIGSGGMGRHLCAHSGPELRCWGVGHLGQLGYGNTQNIGDNEVPASVGLVPYN